MALAWLAETLRAQLWAPDTRAPVRPRVEGWPAEGRRTNFCVTYLCLGNVGCALVFHEPMLQDDDHA